MFAYDARLICYIEAALLMGATTMLGMAWMLDLLR
jgi:hypothetical protein